MHENDTQGTSPDFANTETAFAHLTDAQLRRATWLFSLMNNPRLNAWSSQLGLWALRLRLPFSEKVVRSTVFQQFCGGTSVPDCRPTIDHLSKYGVRTILDYGAEAKTGEADFAAVEIELLGAIDYAAREDKVPVLSLKITGLINASILERWQAGAPLTKAEQDAYARLQQRLATIGEVAETNGVSLFIDAEESWIQDSIDELAEAMMESHNRERAIVFNTFQMYRHDRYGYLLEAHQRAKNKGYLLGAKIVRGAYMEKERARAAKDGYASPIQPNKESTDHDFDLAVAYCVTCHDTIVLYNATHNTASNTLQARLMRERGLPANHPHLNFCQLYGMSDNLTFNLAAAGFNAMKYVPYGKVTDVIPYLIRRAQENSSVSGDAGREYGMLRAEYRRRQKAVRNSTDGGKL